MSVAITAPVKRKPKSCRIDTNDALAIADLVAKRLTEKEACILLNIEPTAWFTYKSRNKDCDIFSNAVARIRAEKVRAHLENIESAGYGLNGHRADWRASDRYLERIDPARFNDRLAMLPSETDAIADTLLAKMLERAYAHQAPAKQVSQVAANDAQVIDVQGSSVQESTGKG